MHKNINVFLVIQKALEGLITMPMSKDSLKIYKKNVLGAANQTKIFIYIDRYLYIPQILPVDSLV